MTGLSARALTRLRGVVGPGLKLAAPTAKTQARELALVNRLAATRSAPRTAWAKLLATHGATDLWLDIARTLPVSPALRAEAQQLMNAARTQTWRVETAAKGLLARPRPAALAGGPAAIGKVSATSSFPSIHATGAFAEAGIATALDPINGSLYLWLARELSLSRVYVGAHFPSDVAAGAQMGSLISNRLLRGAGHTPSGATALAAAEVARADLTTFGRSPHRVRALTQRVLGGAASAEPPTFADAVRLLERRFQGLGADWQRHPRHALEALSLPSPATALATAR